MPANTPLGLPYPLPTEPVTEGAAAIRALAEAAAAIPPLVTVLPATPVDKQEVYFLADAANGIIWHLRYRAASASPYKWEFVGGSPMTAEVQPQAALTGNYNSTGDIGPNVQLPALAGAYLLSFGANAYSTHTAVQTAYYGLAFSATEANDLQAIQWQLAISGGPGRSNSARTFAALLPASVLVRSRGKASAGGSAYVIDRWVSVVPVRLGPPGSLLVEREPE
jgi:hypothetical protein